MKKLLPIILIAAVAIAAAVLEPSELLAIIDDDLGGM